MTVSTLNDIYLRTTKIQRPAAMRYKKDGTWHDISVQQMSDTVRWFSTGLTSLDVHRGDRVAILSENRPEWTMSDLAILTACGVSVPIYSTLLGWQIAYILNDSGSVAVIASDHEQLEKIQQVRAEVPSIREVIVIDSPADLPAGVRTWQSVVDQGKAIESKEGRKAFDERVASARPDELATIVYTSGTTGNPKGAMLTHGNIGSNVASSSQLLPIRQGHVSLSILPLTHILQRMVDFIFLHVGAVIAYNDDLQKVGENLQAVHPDVFVAVPRLFEKMQAKILDNVATAPPLRQSIFRWAMGIARERLPYRVESKPLPFPLSLKSAIAEKLVFGKILDRLGGNVKFTVSGGAPLSAELAAFFIGAGLEIYEGYGLTETSPVIAVNMPGKRRLGTVGAVIPDVEVKIAEDGEIVTRGPNVMKGYFNNEEATRAAIDEQGWFHTGDIGHIDEDGFLKITDRKKDIIVNAYGKNIAPQPLEGLLKTSPFIGTPVLIGDRRKFLTALIVPNFERLEGEARKMGVRFEGYDDLVKNDAILQIFQKEIDRFNENLDRQEKVRKFALLSEDFTIESGEITPSMKVKRKVVMEKFQHLIEEMYQDEGVGDSR